MGFSVNAHDKFLKLKSRQDKSQERNRCEKIDCPFCTVLPVVLCRHEYALSVHCLMADEVIKSLARGSQEDAKVHRAPPARGLG